MLMHQTHRPCLQLDDRAPDPLPNALPVTVALIEHFLGTSCRSDLGTIAVFPDQQIGGSPYIGLRYHKGPPSSDATLAEPQRPDELATAGGR
jgi:hypothetical protein